MVSSIVWIVGALGVLFILFTVWAIYMASKNRVRPIDYQSWFVMGIIWSGAGIAIKNYVMSFMGIVFMIIALVHRKEWKKNRTSWRKLNSAEKKLRIVILILLGLLVFLGLAVFFILQ